MEKLSRIVQEFVLIEGACEAGIATLKTLEGGPPSSDLIYVLPEAKSAITYAVAIDQKPIPLYLWIIEICDHINISQLGECCDIL